MDLKLDREVIMLHLVQCTVPVMLLVVQSTFSTTLTRSPVSIPGEVGICTMREMRNAVIQNISASFRMIIQNNLTTSPNNIVISDNCGTGEWHRVAYLNMSNASQQCPSSWREFNSNGVRGCRRPESSSGSCSATLYPTSRQYSRVCGRAIGYQIGTSNAFGRSAVGEPIDSYYVYGISVTHGRPRNHIWTFVSGISEGSFVSEGWDCPCANSSSVVFPPSFVGDDYYCESGNPSNTYIFDNLYSSDPLWDGDECEGECCSNGKSPPWFSVELTNPTTDDIEVRICIPEPNYDDVIVQQLELHFQ